MNKGRAFGYCLGGTNNRIHNLKTLGLLKSSHSQSGLHSNSLIRHSNLENNQLLLGGGANKMRHYSAATSLYKNMCIKGIPFSNNILINHFCLEGKVDLGFSLLGDSFKRGVVPSVTTFGALLNGLFQDKRLSDAQDMIWKIIYHKLCQPDENMVWVVIEGLERAGNIDLAYEFFSLADGGYAKPNTVMYNTIIDWLCKKEKMDDALGVLSKMIKDGIDPDLTTYTGLIHGFVSLRNWNEVKRLWAEMLSSGIEPNTCTYSFYGFLIDSFYEYGLKKDAIDIFETMIDRGGNPNSITSSTLMDIYCTQGKVNEAKRIVESTKNFRDDRSYEILLHTYCNEEKYEEAMQIIQEMMRKGLDPDFLAFSFVMRGLLQSWRFDLVKDIVSEMLCGTLKPTLNIYAMMLDCLCYGGIFIDEALQLWEKMEREGVEPHMGMYADIIDGLCKYRKYCRARQIFSSLSLKGMIGRSANMYQRMITVLSNHGLVEEAKAVFVQMEANGWLANESTYNHIVWGFLKEEKYDEVASYLDKMAGMEFCLDSCNMECFR